MHTPLPTTAKKVRGIVRNVVKINEPKKIDIVLSCFVDFEPNQLTNKPIAAIAQLTKDA